MSGTMASELFKYPAKWKGGISCSTNDYFIDTPAQWPVLLKPYLGVCVSSSKTEYIMRDLNQKINCIDHRLGLAFLPGLFMCSRPLDTRWVQNFLSVGVDPNTRCFGHSESRLEGGNALHFAVHCEHFEEADMMLDAIADPNAKTAQGKTALDLFPMDAVAGNGPASALWNRLVRWHNLTTRLIDYKNSL
jgi:hypothetical protein